MNEIRKYWNLSTILWRTPRSSGSRTVLPPLSLSFSFSFPSPSLSHILSPLTYPSHHYLPLIFTARDRCGHVAYRDGEEGSHSVETCAFCPSHLPFLPFPSILVTSIILAADFFSYRWRALLDIEAELFISKNEWDKALDSLRKNVKIYLRTSHSPQPPPPLSFSFPPSIFLDRNVSSSLANDGDQTLHPRKACVVLRYLFPLLLLLLFSSCSCSSSASSPSASPSFSSFSSST